MPRIYNNPYQIANTVNTHCIWPAAFTALEADSIITECEKTATIPAQLFNGSNLSWRRNNISWHHVNEHTFWIFQKLNQLFEEANDLFFQYNLLGFDHFQFGVYNVGDFYNYHSDVYYNKPPNEKNYLCRKLSASILLNDSAEFDGGELELCIGNPDQPTAHTLNKGDAVFFPSYLLHRVAPITRGTRKTLVIWALGPKWV